MYVNRAQALLLVGTIAAACGPGNASDQAPGGAAGDVAQGGAAGDVAQAGTSGGAVAAAGMGQGGTANTGGSTLEGAPINEGTYSCDDEAGTALTCSGLESVACEGMTSFLDSQCELSGRLMKPLISDLARACMTALHPPALCDASNAYACIDVALRLSCPDASADDECATIVATCAESLVDVSAEACSTTLSGMTQSGRDRMVDCMSGWCDLSICVEGLGSVAVSAGPYSCNDDAATTLNCPVMQSVACEGMEPFLNAQCAMAVGVMKPRIASAARACMIALGATDRCDAINTYACFDEALRQSCPDTSADDECAAIVATCAESLVAVSAEGCSATLSGLTQTGRNQMVQCMSTACDLYTCVEGLRYPAAE